MSNLYCIFGVFVQFALLTQISGNCSDDELADIRKCRGGGQLYYVYNKAEHGISGLSDILLVNLTDNEFNLHCGLLTDYTECISKISSTCHTKLQEDAVFEGLVNYYKYVCAKARSYADYAAAIDCKGAISQLDSVQTCDKQSQKISLVPGNYGGVCGNITAWMNCYTEATGSECQSSVERKSAVYVMTSQYNLLQKLGEAAHCYGQDFPEKYSGNKTNTPDGGGNGWIHALWISLLAVCLVIGVSIYIVHKKRKIGIPRQRLVNEVA